MKADRILRGSTFGVLAISLGLTGLGTAAAAPVAEQAAAAPRLPASLRLAADAVGSVKALRGLRSFRYSATSQRFILDEGLRPADAVSPAASVESTVRYVLPTRRTPTRLRVDAVRTSVGTARPVHEVLSAKRGFIRGVDANFSTAATKAMTSDRWAAIRSEQALLNPQLLLERAVARPAMARNGGTQRINGRAFRVLVLRNGVAPIRLFVDVRSGRLAMLRTMQADYLRRDVPIEVRYRRWVRAGAGMMFPRQVSLTSDGFTMIRETRRGLTANPTVRGQVFRFPAGVGRSEFQPRLAHIGAATSQWLMSFVNLGFIKDGGQTAINPTRVRDANGAAARITLLGGVANNSMIVRRSNGIVVVEGALHNFRAEAVIDFIRQRFPRQRITHVITTHHHADHASGMRPYVALGATAVVGQEAVPFFRRVFAQRDSRILPDRLDRRGANFQARLRGVPNAGLTLGGAQSEIDVFQIDQDHATDMVVPYVRDQGVLFTSDIYSPPGLPAAGDPNAQAIVDLVAAQGLNPQWIVGGHGTFIRYADFEAAVTGP